MKDFSYMFYPGDVLRDTQFFSDCQKGCYLSVLCCHIENIRISYDLLMLIIRNLNETEQKTFLKIFDKDDAGYYLNWVVTSVEKRSNYLTSRSNNKAGRPNKIKDLEKEDTKTKIDKKTKNEDKKEDIINKSYDYHMVNEYVNEKENIKEDKNEKEIKIKKPKIEIEKSKLETTFDNYLEMRQKIGKPATSAAIELAKNKIREYSKGDENRAVLIIEQSILNGWQGIFDLRENYNKPNQTVQEKTIDKMKTAFEEYQDGVYSGKY